MAANTVYIPEGVNLDPSKVEAFGQGVTSVCIALGSTNIDLALTDDVILTGLMLKSYGVTPGDALDLKLLLTATGAVLKTPITNWQLSVTNDDDYTLAMPMKIAAGSAGITLRATITTTVLLVTPRVSINYKLWKVLV